MAYVTFDIWNTHVSDVKDVFKTLSNIEDGLLCGSIQQFLAVSYFLKR